MRVIWFILGLFSLGTALLGAVLPLLPTTPFLLAAAFCFARSSARLHDWLLAHRHFGPLISNWRVHGAIGRPAKIAAGMALAATFVISLWQELTPSILLAQLVVLTGVAAFVFTRPAPPQESVPDNERCYD